MKRGRELADLFQHETNVAMRRQGKLASDDEVRPLVALVLRKFGSKRLAARRRQIRRGVPRDQALGLKS